MSEMPRKRWRWTDRSQDPPGTRTCSGCGVARPLERFSANRFTRERLESRCRECVNAARKTRKQRVRTEPKHPPATKHCRGCHEVLPAQAFGRDSDSATGLDSRCRGCRNLERAARKQPQTQGPKEQC